LNILFFQVGLRRIAQGKWGNNNGQACIAPDYILVDESIASELVCDSSTDAPTTSIHWIFSTFVTDGLVIQVDTLKDIIEKFYGKDPKLSKDLSRIVNASHYSRLTKLLDDPRISSKIVHGGERDENKL
jgi:aldehyde dehydrogenase (NAD+)